MINSPGTLTGTAASLLSDIVIGTDDWFMLQSGDSPHHKVVVTGQSPANGYIWAHNIRTGKVIQILGSTTPEVQYKGTYDYALSGGQFGKDGISAAVTTIGDLNVADFLDTGTGSGNGLMGRKVSVWDQNGIEVSAGVGKSWELIFSTGVVTEIDDSTNIESYQDSTISNVILA